MPPLPPEIEEIAAVVEQHIRPVIEHGLKVPLMLREIGCRAADDGHALLPETLDSRKLRGVQIAG